MSDSDFLTPKRPTPSYFCGRCSARESITQDSPGQQLLQFEKWREKHKNCKWPCDAPVEEDKSC